MDTRVLITVIWGLLVLLTALQARRKNIKFPSLRKPENLILFLLELFLISLCFFWRRAELTSGAYELIGGSIILFLGWLISYQNLFIKSFKEKTIRAIIRSARLFIWGSDSQQNKHHYGDWLQLVGFLIIWGSFPALFLALAIYPVYIFILSSKAINDVNNKIGSKDHYIKNEIPVWLAKSLFRHLFVAGFLLVVYAILRRDFVLFFGTFQDAFGLLTTLAQVEATIFALVITFLFVLIDFANSAYSPRLVGSFANLLTFRVMASLAIISVAIKFLFVSNARRLLNLSDFPNDNILIDWTLLWVFVVGLSYYVFIRQVLRLMTPEGMANHILVKLDDEWMKIIREEWSPDSRWSHRAALDQDPLIPFERYLSAIVERGDIYSFEAALAGFHRKLVSVRQLDDGPAIDNYLSDNLESIIVAIAKQKLSSSMETLCHFSRGVTAPSSDNYKSFQLSMFDPPLGARVFRIIAENCIENQLVNPGYLSVSFLGERGEKLLSELPPYAELWTVDSNNDDLLVGQAEKHWKGDRRFDNYIDGFLYYMGTLGEQASQKQAPELVSVVSHVLISQMNKTLEIIQEKDYQRHIIQHILFALDRIVSSVCLERVKKGVDFSIVSYGKLNDLPKEIAEMLVNYFSKFVEKMARANILDARLIIDISLLVLGLKLKHPKLAIQMIETFGVAGELLVKDKDFLAREYREYILFEIDRRIDQIRPLMSDK